MHHRQWWPAADCVDLSETAGAAFVTDAFLKQHQSNAGTMSAWSHGLAQTGMQGLQAAEAADATCSSPQCPHSGRQSEATSLDWQTALLRKLLPDGNVAPLAPAGQIQPSCQQSPLQQLSNGGNSSFFKDSKQTETASASPFLYAGIFLDPLSTARLLAWCPPKHIQLSADHLTLLYRPTAEQVAGLSLGASVELQLVSKAQDSTIQAVLVRCPLWVAQLLHCPAHVTVSRADGVKAKTAANLLRRVQQGLMVGTQTEQCQDTITLTGRVGVKLEGGSIAFSASQLAGKTAHGTATATTAAEKSPASVQSALTLATATTAAEKSPPSIQSAVTPATPAQHCHNPIEGAPPPPTAEGAVTSLQEQAHARQALPTPVQPANRDMHRPKAATAAAAAKLNTSRVRAVPAAAASGLQQTSNGHSRPLVPYVQYEEDLSDEDALEALQQLDALLAPSKCTRFSTGPGPSSARQPGRVRDSTRRQTPGSANRFAGAHTSTAGNGAARSLYNGLQPQTGSRTAAQTDAVAPRSTARRLWSASNDIQRASSSSPVPVPMRILKRPSIASNPCSTSPIFAVSPPLALQTDASLVSRVVSQTDTERAACTDAQSDIQSEAYTARQTDRPTMASPAVVTNILSAAAVASIAPQTSHTVCLAAANLKRSELSTLADLQSPELSNLALAQAAAEAATRKPDFSSTALSNERLRSQSVFKYLQRQQHGSQGRKSEALTEPTFPSAADAASMLGSGTAQKEPSATGTAHAASSPTASKDGGPVYPPRNVADSQADVQQGLLTSRQNPSRHSPTAGSPGPCPSPALEGVPRGAPTPGSSEMGGSTRPGGGLGSAGSPQERSSSPVDDLVMEMQVQHLLDKVPGLLPAMANFTLKACQGNVDQAITLLQQHLPALAELSPATSAPVAAMPPPSAAAAATACTAAHSAPDSSNSLQHSPVDLERDVSHGRRSQSMSQQSPAGSCHVSANESSSNRQSPDELGVVSSSISSRQSPGELAAISSISTSKPVLLPAGAAAPARRDTSPALTASSRRSHRKCITHSPATAPLARLQASVNPTHISSGSSDSETDFYDTTGPNPRQPEFAYDGFLLAADPVAAAVDEAGRLVAERTKMKTVADQERQALGLHRQARNTYFAAAQMAFEKGNREAAQELASKGKEHAQLAKEARHRANQAAYDSCNLSVTNRFKVDLHGLHVEEALQVMEQHLLSLGGLGCPGGVLLQVVTGVGKHSLNGRPKILPAVVRYLSDAGYRFNEAFGNSGVLDVFIGGQRGIL